jgi:hypothetical protein
MATGDGNQWLSSVVIPTRPQPKMRTAPMSTIGTGFTAAPKHD